MPRESRRDALLDAALRLFAERGYDGTSVADIADAVGVSKAAVSYHFPAKDDLLTVLTDGVLSGLEALVRAASTDGAALGRRDRRRFLEEYVDLLLVNAAVATWIDVDRGVLAHDPVGSRITALHEATRRLLGGGDDGIGDLASTSALGALWRPIRNIDAVDEDDRNTLVDVAVAALDAVEG